MFNGTEALAIGIVVVAIIIGQLLIMMIMIGALDSKLGRLVGELKAEMAHNNTGFQTRLEESRRESEQRLLHYVINHQHQMGHAAAQDDEARRVVFTSIPEAGAATAGVPPARSTPND